MLCVTFNLFRSLLVHLSTHQFGSAAPGFPEGVKIRAAEAEGAEKQPISASASHSCRFCPRRFAFASDLAAHTNALHTKEKSFGCEECPKRFFHRSSLRVHVRCVHFVINA